MNNFKIKFSLSPALKMLLIWTIFVIHSSSLRAQDPIERIEPPNWWVGMQSPDLQILLYGKDIADLEPRINYKGVSLEQTIRTQNNNYLFLNLHIGANTKPGNCTIAFYKDDQLVTTIVYDFEPRPATAPYQVGFDASDALYLITPDRFANGSIDNDAVAGLLEQPDRNNKGGRHGGDIEGIRQQLDYISNLGFTAIWLNPLLENDMQEYSYHGYSTTDFYKVDPRFGSNESYRQLAREANQKGIGLIMDMIVNHCGLNHWWMKDLPAKDWINQWPTYTQTNHRKTVLQDPYAAAADKKIFADGWFVPTMPDLNQRNPLMGTYLIQNSIWWIEYLGLTGIRMDTYPYPDMDYMTEWTKRVMKEYPNFKVVGEEWFEWPAIVSYWQQGKNNPNGYTSDLTSVMDFPVQNAFVKALNEPEGFKTGWITVYEMLSQDYLYPDPMDLVIFPDNHDMSRIFTQLNEDSIAFEMAMIFFATTRGVPQFYYGTEILMTNPGTTDHGIIRSDFPGGWTGDSVNGFSGNGLTEKQKSARAFISQLLNWRKNATAIHNGQLKHFIPEEGVYIYFRTNEKQRVMVILNKNKTPYELELNRFSEMLEGVTTGKEILSGKNISMNNKILLEKSGGMIIEY